LWAQWRPADTVTIPIDPTGKGAAWVLADSYDVRVQADSARLRGTVHLRNGMLIDRPEAARQFDVPLTRVSGKVTRNGRRVPRTQQSGTTRGRLFFERDDGSYLATEIPGSGPAEFSIGVPPGTWKVRVTGDPWSGTLPLVPTTVASSFAVGSSSVEDVEFDVPAVRFLGQLTLNGERLPDDPTAETRGNLELQAKDGNIGYNLPIPATGPALFDVLLGPAEYDVQVAQWWFAVGDSPPPNGVLPLGKWPVGTVDVSTTIQRDVDLRTFEVRLELVEHGDRLAATNSETRGELWVEDTSTGRIARRLDIPADGASQVTTTVYPGHYRVIFQPDPSLETLPLQPVVLDTLDIGEDTTERYDVGGISLRGTITVNGEPLEAGPDGRGTISFLRFPTVADTTVDADVDPDFDVTVAPGPYNVLFEPASNHPQLPNGAVLLSKNCVDVRLQTQ
jgi:hypothetical protein